LVVGKRARLESEPLRSLGATRRWRNIDRSLCGSLPQGNQEKVRCLNARINLMSVPATKSMDFALA